MLSIPLTENANMPEQGHFTSLWRRVKFPKAQKYSLWSDLEIPAKLFYKVSETQDLSLLIIKGRPGPKPLEKAWFSIIDRVFDIRKDGRSRNIQAKQVQIALLNQKIRAIEAIIGVLYKILLTKKQQKELLNTLKKLGIHLKNNDQAAIKRALQRDVKGLKTKLKIEIGRLEEMKKPLDKKMEYERVCLKISRAIDLKLDINMTLAEFLAAEAEAIEVSNKIRKNG